MSACDTKRKARMNLKLAVIVSPYGQGQDIELALSATAPALQSATQPPCRRAA